MTGIEGLDSQNLEHLSILLVQVVGLLLAPWFAGVLLQVHLADELNIGWKGCCCCRESVCRRDELLLLLSWLPTCHLYPTPCTTLNSSHLFDLKVLSRDLGTRWRRLVNSLVPLS